MVEVGMGEASRAEARIKQLCCLGLGGQAVMPALLRELHALIPSFSNLFMWANADLQLANLYGEMPEIAEVGPLYLERFYNRGDREVGGFTDTLRRVHGVDTRDQALTVDRQSFYRGDLYNLVMRPLGGDDFIRLVVREGGRPLGAVVMYRDAKTPPFTPADIRRLASLEPFIAHALTVQPSSDIAMVGSGENGLVIADANGKLIYSSAEARRLLFLATHPLIAANAAPPDTVLPAAVVRICRNLAAVYTGDEAACAPVHQHRNSWGGFTFRAYRLDASDTASCMVGVTISRDEPLPLRLLRQMDKVPLSGRQAQVCLLMAGGLSYRAIAERLHISPHTAIAHSRSIYNTLDVSNRTELVNKLLAA
jgi:DNA-binding CsgD family transcriptional regulator